jgi:acyl carrier protein
MKAEDVIAVINGPICKLGTAIGPDSALMSSGLLDSLALFHLTLWIEEEIGRPLDLFSLDLVRQWDTPALIAAYVEQERRQRAG